MTPIEIAIGFISFISFSGMIATALVGKMCQPIPLSNSPACKCKLPEWFMLFTMTLWLVVGGLALYAASLTGI